LRALFDGPGLPIGETPFKEYPQYSSYSRKRNNAEIQMAVIGFGD